MFTVPAAIRRGVVVSPPIFTGPVTIPDVTVDSPFIHQMSQYFTGIVDSYALTNNGGQAWLSINTSTGELSGTTPATPVTVSGVIVTATNTGGSTPTDAFDFEVTGAGYGDSFVTAWTVADNDNVLLPLRSTGSYNFTVDWGDGTQDTITAFADAAKDHTYTSAGTYEVIITGRCTIWYMQDSTTAMRQKLAEIRNWGNIELTSLAYAFTLASNMVITATDEGTFTDVGASNFVFNGCSSLDSTPIIWPTCRPTSIASAFTNLGASAGPSVFLPDMSRCTTASTMAQNSESFNADVSGWNIPLMENMFSTLRNTSFNHDISGWEPVSVTSAISFMASVTTFSTANYDALLIAWSQLSGLQPGTQWHFGNSTYSAGAATTARQILTDAPNNWDITDGGPA